MEFHYLAYYLLLSCAALGALFVPSVRAFCLCVLILSLAEYAVKASLEDMSIFGKHRNGFMYALLDVGVAALISSIFHKDIIAKLMALMFTTSAFIHMSMTLAVIEKTPTIIYTNYEILIAITSLIQAALLFGNLYIDAYRYYCNGSNNINHGASGLGRGTVNKDIS